ncbi:hypothetical protein J7T55_005133 [Diaporthe amygdali]|uniref:uncharacterized protein n=1 Tax=Phomopsis amygdali TaxID=1214568 RepID=UPI0022FE975B|nr:uncharacterized protein J7T55_005133 [Diaporthe amygdali]KAJ0116187.1 hypothetical protein J7T55_005133 [Diaporthe amygdali]
MQKPPFSTTTLQDAFDGKLIVRFDDTNPAKEKQEFEESILHDLGLLGIKPDQVTYTSDHFSQLNEIAEQMIRDGNRSDRAIPHHRTGSAWNIYPTYDFACPVVDSIEGATHALRTTEYADHNEQYSWFLDTLSLQPVYVWDFARISFIRTFLSKRKLARVVDSGVVTGWDDPRMPTIRGILRRGLTHHVTRRHTAVETKQMVTAVIVNGPDAAYCESKRKHPKNPAVGTKIVTYGRSIILDQADAACLSRGEKFTLMGWTNAVVEECNTSGDGTVEDLVLTLQLGDTDFRKTKKITWLAGERADLVKAELWDFDYFLTKDTLGKKEELDDYLSPVSASRTEALCDADVAHLKTDDIIQLERKGIFRVDKAIGEGPVGNVILFKIPNPSKG